MWNGLSGKQRSKPGQLYSYLEDSVFITPQTHEHPGRIQFGSLIGKNVIESNQWTHLAFVRRKNTVNVYLNGSSSSDISATFTLKDSIDKTLKIGSIYEGPNQQSTEGKFDEISVFNRALTIQEIQKHVRSGAVAGMIKEPNPLPDSSPHSPENSMELTHVRSGYTLELVAAEPLVKDPVAIDWGSDGRLWVAEMADYPYGMNGNGSPGGRIRYLQDRDSDGVYDHSTLFMDKLAFPTGVLEWKNGILVTAAPEIFYAEDTDGDGRADKKIVLFEGFMTGNQQLRVNGLRWGPDNWIYCASGGHHTGFGASNEIKSLIAEERIPLGSRDFRFQPDKGLLEPRSGPSQFGRVRDNWGNWFGVQNSFPLWHYVLEDHYLTRNPHLAIGDIRNQLRGRANPKVFSASTPQKRFHSYEQSERFTSACGPSLYRDSLLFPDSDTLHAFTCEPFHNVVQHSLLRKEGASFSGQRDPEDGPLDFFTSADRWSRPVMTRTGPDGALWIVDMYRYMIEHPDWLPENGRDELKPFYRSGEELGRIYRIYPNGKRPVIVARLSEMTPLKLVKQFNHSNGQIRDRAQQLLVTNGEISVVPNLEKMLRNHSNPLTRFHALCTLQGLQKLTSDLLMVALDDTVPEIRRQALITAERFNDSSDILVSKLCRMVKDPDPTVQLQLALSLGEWDEPEAGKALVEIAQYPNIDSYLQIAVMTSIEKHYKILMQSFIDSGIIPRGTILKTVLSMGLSSKSFLLDDLLVEVFSKNPTVEKSQPLKLLHTWQNVLHEEGLTTDSLGTGPYAFLKNSGNAVRDFLKNVEQWTTDSTISIGIRSKAILALGRAPTLRQNHMIRLEHCLDPSMPRELQSAVIRSLTQIQTYEAANLILGKWMEITPEVRRTVLENILSRKQMADSLLDHLQNTHFATKDIETVYRKRLLNHQDEAIAKKARTVFSSIAEISPNPNTHTFPEALSLSGNTQKGLSVFTQRCSACHRENDNEKSVGPELGSITDRSSESLLFSILNPSDSVEPKYIAYDFTLNNEESFQGLIESESGNSLSIRLSDGSLKTILRQSIQSVRSQKQSLMPEGLAEGLSGQQMADLLAYVQQMD
ncbi:MAG TPA: c-type cytochrome [Verrucomicrobiales bacterium]|nr:c-type cytochrome [Verrucomicrobiales bacterium]